MAAKEAVATPKEKPDLKAEVADGLWRAGAEAVIETARDTLVTLLAADLPEEERKHAESILLRVLSGKLGTAIVSATAGGALYVANVYDVSVPLLDEETSERLGKEFRVLGISSATKTAFDKFVAPLRDVAMLHLGSAVGKLGKATAELKRAKEFSVKRVETEG